MNAVQSGDFFNNRINQDSYRAQVCRGTVWNGNAFQAKKVARVFGKPVTQFIDEGGMNNHAENAQPV